LIIRREFPRQNLALIVVGGVLPIVADQASESS
jgi:hypothetical protein